MTSWRVPCFRHVGRDEKDQFYVGAHHVVRQLKLLVTFCLEPNRSNLLVCEFLFDLNFNRPARNPYPTCLFPIIGRNRSYLNMEYWFLNLAKIKNLNGTISSCIIWSNQFYLFNDWGYCQVFDAVVLGDRALEINVAQASQSFLDDWKV